MSYDEYQYKRYKRMPTDKLTELAEKFFLNLAAVNRPEAFAHEDFALPPTSNVVVEASPKGVRYNFASKAVVGLIMEEIPAVDCVLAEAWSRLDNLGHIAKFASLMLGLEQEAAASLDKVFGEPRCAPADLAALPARIERDLGTWHI